MSFHLMDLNAAQFTFFLAQFVAAVQSWMTETLKKKENNENFARDENENFLSTLFLDERKVAEWKLKNRF